MKINHIAISHTLMLIIAFLFFSESGQFYLNNIDDKMFFALNSTLGMSEFWDRVWMVMNHKVERVVVVFIIMAITFSSIFFAKTHKDQRIYLANSITAIFFVGTFVALNFILFSRIFPVERLSPSLVYDSFISLQDMFNAINVKVSSTKSFPGDHAFVATAWALLTLRFAPKNLRYAILPVWLLMSTARLFAGAHWFTDITFSICFAYFLYSYATLHNVWFFVERKVLSVIKKFDSKKIK